MYFVILVAILFVLEIFLLFYIVKIFSKEDKIFIFIGVGILFIIPIFVDLLLGISKIGTYQSNAQWSSFLGSYLGGTIGAFITLYGIRWQVTRGEKQKEKEKIKSFLEGVKDHLDRCFLSKNFNDVTIKSFMVLSYNSTTFGHNGDSDFFYPLENHGITLTYDIMYNFDKEFRKSLLDVADRILAYNKHYSFLFSHLNLKKEFISNLQKNSPKKIKDITLSLQILSNVLQGICLSYSKIHLDHYLTVLYNSSTINKETKERMKTLNLITESKRLYYY